MTIKKTVEYVNDYTGESFSTEEECRKSERAYATCNNFPTLIDSSFNVLCTETREDKIEAITSAEFVIIHDEEERVNFNRIVKDEGIYRMPIESIGMWQCDFDVYDEDDGYEWINFYKEYEYIVHAYNKLTEASNAV